MLIPLLLLASATAIAAEPHPAHPPVSTKVFRPGVNGTALVPGRGVALVAWGYSQGGPPQGLSGFYEYGIGYRTALIVTQAHFVSRASTTGLGDTSFGAKFKLANEARRLPLLAISYTHKNPTAAKGLGTGFADDKVLLYADKTWGRARFSLNHGITWAGRAGGGRRLVQLPSLGVLWASKYRWGAAGQGYYSYSTATKYGGFVAAPTFHLTPEVSVYAGVDRRFAASGGSTGFVTGLTLVHRPRK